MGKTEAEIYRKDAKALETASEEVFKQAQQAGNERAAELALEATNYANYAKNALDGNDIEKAKSDINIGNKRLSSSKAALEGGK